MARFRAQQREIELLQVVVEERGQRGEAFAGAGFDVGAADELVDQRQRFVGAHFLQHPFGVAAGGDFDVRNVAGQHRLAHLPEVVQLLFNQQHHAVDERLAPRVVGFGHHAFANLPVQGDEVRLRAVAEGELFVGFEPVEQRVGTAFVGDVFTHQQQRGLGGLELAHHVVGEQQRQVRRVAGFINPCLRGRALEEVEYGGEYLRVIHGSALKKRWRAPPPETLSDARRRRLRRRNLRRRLLRRLHRSDLRSRFPSRRIPLQTSRPGSSAVLPARR